MQAVLLYIIVHLYKYPSLWQDVFDFCVFLDGSYYTLYRPVNEEQISVCFQPIKAAEKQPVYHNCVSLCSLCDGEELIMAIYISFTWIAGTETNMLLIMIFRVIALLALVCGDCDHGTQKLKDFDWNKVGVNVSTYYL